MIYLSTEECPERYGKGRENIDVLLACLLKLWQVQTDRQVQVVASGSVVSSSVLALALAVEQFLAM